MAPTTKSGFGRAKVRTARDHLAPVTTKVKGQAKTHVFRIAGVQMASGPNVAANLNEAGRLIKAAALHTALDRLPRGSGVVVAPVNPAYQASLRKSQPALTHRVIHRV